METMSLKAKVKGGRLMLDEPTTLPEGAVVELVEADSYSHLDNEDPSVLVRDDESVLLDSSIKRGLEQARRGEGRSVEEFLATFPSQ